ncbi:PepSY domain-containing protein [Pseudaminobacter sp. NGMCC 1.201702]|uniref:PepSY domain-containing protein n=1 Tax=Pseudaminobacter sp. NGMCC 1.201702 TaxID=3391825 RepID=UPI0039F04106
MKIALALCTALASSGAVYAQTAPTTPNPETPAVTTPDTANPTAPVAGENSFTEAQAKSRIEDKGYSNVADLKLGEDGIWRAKADKGGAMVEVALDYQGNITEGAK